MNDPAERRTAQRVKVALNVTFVCDGKSIQGTIENISCSGVLLTSQDPVPQDAIVSITLTDPITRASHSVTGEVVRSVAAAKVGIAFVNLDESALGFIKRIVGSP
jgi:c-di-GMP-binding flagellar brake protein YcgR